jgi:hypothetical protein
MTTARNFVAELDRAEKRQQEIKSLIDSTYGDKKMSYSDINCLIKAVKYLKLSKGPLMSRKLQPPLLESLATKPSTLQT